MEDEVKQTNYALKPKFSIWQKLGFGEPATPFFDIDSLKNSGFKDTVLHSRIELRVGYLDRIRLLVSGRAMVKTTTAAENDFGKTIATSAVSVLPPIKCGFVRYTLTLLVAGFLAGFVIDALLATFNVDTGFGQAITDHLFF